MDDDLGKLTTGVAMGRRIYTNLKKRFSISSLSVFRLSSRGMVFTTLVSVNLFLTLVNRSFYYSVLTTLRYRNPLLWAVIGLTTLLLPAMLYMPWLSGFLGLAPLDMSQIIGCLVTAFASAIGFEVYKFTRRTAGRAISDTNQPHS
jgi:Ca2+-transporting ATPase